MPNKSPRNPGAQAKRTSPLPWRVTMLTLFPEMFPGPLGVSLVGTALERGLWTLDSVPLRDFGLGRHRTVDDRPAGGGAGMVMRADVLGAAVDHARAANNLSPVLYLSPRGEPLNQSLVHELSDGPGVILLAGRFEGIDERVIEARDMREISLGDYVLSGGELAAMALIDAAVRLLPGVLGAEASLRDESFEGGLLEYPQFTQPRLWEGREVPEVLLSGNHKRIEGWRRGESERLTKERRPDLWAKRPKAED